MSVDHLLLQVIPFSRNNERQVEMLNQESIFKSKLGNEAEALRKRLAQGRSDQNRARQQALEKLLLRYHNTKADMEQNHRLERQKFEKEILIENKAVQNARNRTQRVRSDNTMSLTTTRSKSTPYGKR